MLTFRNMLCKIGFHKYKRINPHVLCDPFPFFGEKYEEAKRRCEYCGKVQYWLPGFGGSVLGSWEDYKNEHNLY